MFQSDVQVCLSQLIIYKKREGEEDKKKRWRVEGCDGELYEEGGSK